ncbi:hypothetical protein QRO08_16545 [Paracidovorax citrulli]|uniref:Uncharacterized protein n=2 Tax=Paracidovorax citrulli TaxID=80869 RepID=A1TMP1_PARC0|nr:hypothetical protein [Paracidovorax citrulli]ABM32229.1 hypothetical protein Aave_1642 [Paracidovorax citrulli AAC00-1]ATG94753.1 hypothetical protein CQB05_12545 [Paracidovorax citrulli]MVT38518.1 hypothetical protein [Paracidovorax citrulli]PVY66425.1 hypothetical protein C8E08_3832 [Paracidovorax citrulli]REG69405.1 hypothetical protein C8E07_2555 [Paracidovorax citrulli]
MSTGLYVELTELRRSGMRLRPEEWPAPVDGELRMYYWDGRRNSSRRTLREVTLWGYWGTTEQPIRRMTDPLLIDILGDAMLLQGQVLGSVEGRLYEHFQLWLVRPKRHGAPPLPPFDHAAWAGSLPQVPPPREDRSVSEKWLQAHPEAKGPR